MKDHPILFSAPMVRALLDGSKTQTRRIAPVASLDINNRDGGFVTWRVEFVKAVKGVLAHFSGGKFSEEQARRIIASEFNPYGQPGDRLWVRETHYIIGEGTQFFYKATGGFSQHKEYDEANGNPPLQWHGPWKPSIFMPRHASRITLEITGVRVERLQDISRGDAMAEGCPLPNMAQGDDPRKWYAELWESINGPGSWDANPWVWCLSFRRITS